MLTGARSVDQYRMKFGSSREQFRLWAKEKNDAWRSSKRNGGRYLPALR